ncbi:unnamed protein product [Prorocentrum cordatum]|uniref:Uncharacterized protein n=1 Tax=Prorocentrum cordatum TaxID=2364126 RepID=A0ABN9X0E0_9DINO|nr:unnamed protein product [Polarella glacialis]
MRENVAEQGAAAGADQAQLQEETAKRIKRDARFGGVAAAAPAPGQPAAGKEAEAEAAAGEEAP